MAQPAGEAGSTTAGSAPVTEGDAGSTDGAGIGPAAKAVAEGVAALVRAEIDLAKAELAEGAKAKATGIGLLIGTAVLVWLAVQGLLIAAGLALALVMPGWAAALVVAGALLLVALVFLLVARPRLRAPVGVTEARAQAQRDVDWAKSRLQAPRTRQQVQEDVEWTRSRLTSR